ncbi:MAG: hypothetical protein H7338_01315 [Candidatus Sericytochromatia bacterium]|nr:hypothetical protein [Candidatus Sericytochromatia bacterium]
MASMALLFLVGAALMGMGLVHHLAGDHLGRGEKGLWGLATGWMLGTGAAYSVALLQGRIAVPAQNLLVLGIYLAALALWVPILRRWADWRPLSLPSDLPAIGLLFVYFLPVSIYLWSTRMFRPASDGLYSGGASWADMCLHLAISNAFLHGANFPPVYMIFPPAPLRYPFLPDFLTALLMGWGLEAWEALTVTAVPMVLAVVGLLYYLARRITASRAAAALSVLLFAFNGGLGFLYFFRDLWNHTGSRWDFWVHLHENYGRLWDANIHWSNVIVDTLLPQRASIFGFAGGFMILTVFAMVWQRWVGHPHAAAGPWMAWRPLLAAGVMTGLMPLFHTFTYMTVGLISGFLCLIRPNRTWLVYWVPAVLIALPQLGLVAGHAADRGFMFFNPGWMSHFDRWGPIVYFIRNLGLPLLLLIPAWWSTSRTWKAFYGAFLLLMVVALTISVSPHEYNNLKLMYYWYAMSSILVAAWLVRRARVHGRRLTSCLMAVCCVLTGLLTVHAEEVLHWRIFSRDAMAVAAFAREQTPPKALFLTGLNHDQPLTTLAGRQVVLGYTGWIASHGYNVTRREADVKTMFTGTGTALGLMHHYGVNYVLIGPVEINTMGAQPAVFDRQFPVVYRQGEYTVYQVDQGKI